MKFISPVSRFRPRPVLLGVVLLLLLSAPVPSGMAQDGMPPQTVYLPVISRPETGIPVSTVLLPFDTYTQDSAGPSSWAANYGKTPEIIAASNGTELDILAQDYDPATPWTAVLMHAAPRASGTGYKVVQALTGLPMLDRVMGLALDPQGNRYYATGVNESSRVNANYPPPNIFRSDIVRVVKVSPNGDVLFNVDLDVARGAKSSTAEMIINPMVAGSARLAVGGGEIALVHGNNTAPDWNIGGQRHQKALSTRLDLNGNVTRTSSVWVSHSFDHRLLFDGAGIIEYHLGDAYKREVVFSKNHGDFSAFYIKGPLGENLTATRLGNVALVQNDPTYGYLALFATERTPTAGTMYTSMINGPRNLAVVRINRGTPALDPALPDILTVTSCETTRTNRLKWLTAYSGASQLHAERPKLVGLGGDHYIVLWEQWKSAGSYSDTFQGVYAMLIDAQGSTLAGPRLITATQHLLRGDDAFFLNGSAGWVTGDAGQKKLFLHLVDVSLNYQKLDLD